MGEGSYKTFGERNWYENAAVPAAAILNDPNPSFTKKARRLNSLPGSAGVIFFSSDIWLLRASNRDWRFGSEWSINGFNRDQSGSLGRSQVVGLHGNGADRTARGAEPAANTARLV